MSRMVCFIDNDGMVGTCSEEGRIIDCKKCSFYKKFKGKERENNFYYTFWLGFVKVKK